MKTTSLILNTYTVFSEIKPKDKVKKIQKDFAGDINYKKAFRALSSLKNKSEKINIETLDGCHLRSSFKGVLFSVTALNGDGHNVIIAFGIYPIENNQYWNIFVNNINKSLHGIKNMDDLTLLFNREKGIKNAVTDILPKAHLSHCLLTLKGILVVV
ncbi:hypothetical protein BB558_006641 [Smittium angustum]|uniref:MULE transposase domain-containing protein n=1 Tax=Smittium angustum TaxID=133377 RepID=A0A2U1IX57_SMIAN|nr:hypothetical protein BB558_006641 [Smittium angustum]